MTDINAGKAEIQLGIVTSPMKAGMMEVRAELASVTTSVNEVNKSLKSLDDGAAQAQKSMKGMGDGAKLAEKSLKDLGEHGKAGMQEFQGGVKELTGEFPLLGKAIEAVANPWVALGAAIAGAAAAGIEWIKSGIELGKELDDFSDSAGLTAQQVAQLQRAAILAGVGIEPLNAAVIHVSKSIGEALSDASSTAGHRLTGLGLNLYDLRNMATSDRFNAVAAAIAGIADPSQRAAAEMELMGKSGTKLDTMLANLGTNLDKAKAGMTTFGTINEDVAKVEQLGIAWDTFWRSWKEAGLAAAASLAPALAGIAKSITPGKGGDDETIPQPTHWLGRAETPKSSGPKKAFWQTIGSAQDRTVEDLQWELDSLTKRGEDQTSKAQALAAELRRRQESSANSDRATFHFSDSEGRRIPQMTTAADRQSDADAEGMHHSASSMFTQTEVDDRKRVDGARAIQAYADSYKASAEEISTVNQALSASATVRQTEEQKLAVWFKNQNDLIDKAAAEQGADEKAVLKARQDVQVEYGNRLTEVEKKQADDRHKVAEKDLADTIADVEKERAARAAAWSNIDKDPRLDQERKKTGEVGMDPRKAAIAAEEDAILARAKLQIDASTTEAERTRIHEQTITDLKVTETQRRNLALEQMDKQNQLARLAAYGDFFGNLATLTEGAAKNNEAAFYVNKAFSMAQAEVNAWLAFSNVMGNTALSTALGGWPGAQEVMAETAFAAGQMAVVNIASQEYGGARAGGGPVSAGKQYLVGERGPEIISMGSVGGNVTPNNRIGGGVTINVHNYSGQPVSTSESTAPDGSKLIEMIVGQVQSRQIKDIRNRGELARTMEATYAINRSKGSR